MYLQHRRSEVYCLHVDQNEKIVMFGVVHVLAVDEYSKKIVSLVVWLYMTLWSVSKCKFVQTYVLDECKHYLGQA